MTLKEKIIQFMNNNQGQMFTTKEISVALGQPESSVTKSLRQLSDWGEILREADPKFLRRRLFGHKKSFKNHLKIISKSFENHFFRGLLIYIIILNIRIKHILKKRPQNPFFSETPFEDLENVYSVLDKFLTPSARELLDTIPGETIERIDQIVENEIFPLLRKPVESLGPRTESSLGPRTESAPLLDTTKKTDPGAPAKPKEAPLSVEERYRSTGKTLARICKKKTPSKPKDELTAYSKAIKRKHMTKEARIAESPFIPHIRYYGIQPQHRDFEFAKAWSTIMRRFFKSYVINKWHKEYARSFTSFRRSGDFGKNMKKARIEADLLSARYEDYMVGIAEYYFDRSASCGREMNPNLAHLAGEDYVAAAKDYVETTLKGRILITLDDIKYSGNADFLLGGNFQTSIMDPDSASKINEFYHDILYIAIERAAYFSSYELLDLVTFTIDYGILSKEWAEGYGKFHNLDCLKGYRFKAPGFYDADMIFKCIQK